MAKTDAHLKIRRGWLIIAALILASALGGCGEERVVQIGFAGGLSGRFAVLGADARDGALLALEQAQTSGQDHFRWSLVVIDDENDPAILTERIRELGPTLDGLIGPVISDMAHVLVPEINRLQLLTISPTVSSEDFSGQDDFFLRVAAPLSRQATVVAKHLFLSLQHQRIAVIYDTENSSYTRSFRESFTRKLESLGGEVCAAIPFRQPDGPLLRDVVEAALVSEPDAILCLASAFDTAMISQQLEKANPDVPRMASEWAASKQILDYGGASVDGLYIAQSVNPYSMEPGFLEFRKAFEDRFGHSPAFAAIQAYDATRMMIEGIRRHPHDPTRRKRFILERSGFIGVQETIILDEFGDAHRSVYIMQVRDGDIECVAQH